MELDELPSGWRAARIREICEPPQYGYTASAQHAAVGPKMLRITDIQDGRVDWSSVPFCRCSDVEKYRLKAGDILFARTGATTGKSFLVHEVQDAVFASYLIRLRVRTGVLPEYLFCYFQSSEYWAAVGGGIDDGNRPNMNGSKLAELVVPFPETEAEQRRIVARLEALTRRLDQARQARQAALAEAATCLSAAVARAFAAAAESSIRPLGEVTGIIGGNSIPENAPPPNAGEERVGLMKVSDMNTPGNERFIASCKLETNRAAAVARKLRIVPAGAVVFPKRGGAIATNKKRVLTIPAALDPNMMGVYPRPESGLISDFLFWWFESLDLAELQEDGGIPQVNKKHLDPLPIPILSESEQRAIVARLDALRGKLDELQRLQREVEAELASFTPALLAKAFKGEL